MSGVRIADILDGTTEATQRAVNSSGGDSVASSAPVAGSINLAPPRKVTTANVGRFSLDLSAAADYMLEALAAE